jgi:hypothetical protein
MPEWSTKRVLITVRTYPSPATKSVEASCTGGITAEGEWIRLYPVPYRLMDDERRFSKWQWIDVSTLKATNDSRPESFKLNIDSIKAGETIGTQGGWRERRALIEPLRRPSLCRIQQERDQKGFPTLGFFRPHEITGLKIEPAEQKEWTPEQLAILRQTQDSILFQRAPPKILEKIPFDFRYKFRCGDVDCKGHAMICTDWEMAQSYRSWKREYGDKWEHFFLSRYETEMIERFDTHFFVGTLNQYPSRWIIVGLFYPPKSATRDLFQR